MIYCILNYITVPIYPLMIFELNYINNVLYYKVLPKNLFIIYNSYFLYKNMKSNLSKKSFR